MCYGSVYAVLWQCSPWNKTQVTYILFGNVHDSYENTGCDVVSSDARLIRCLAVVECRGVVMRRLMWIVVCGLIAMMWPAPAPVAAADSVTAIGVGPYHACAVMNKQVWCWGKNNLGQLGDGTTTNRAGAVRVIKESDGLPLQNATAVDASVGHSCAIVDKQVWCWGSNFEGKLGVPSTDTESLGAVQVQVNGGGVLSNVTAIALGYHFSCAISNAQVWCWGDNQEGEIGDGTTSAANNGAVLADYGGTAFSNVTKIAAGRKFMCAINNAKVYCWGANNVGQLGRGSVSGAPGYELDATHVRQEGDTNPLTGATDISAGWEHACGVFVKRVYCWGNNNSGQLGINDKVDRNVAKESQKSGSVTFTNATRAVAGSPFSCAIENQGVWCWGENTNGSLATNTLTESLVGVASQYRGGGVLSGVTALDVGLNHACAIIKKQVWCWGYNSDQQVGDGTSEARLGAVRVMFDQSVTAVSRNLQPSTAVSGGLYQSCAVVNKQAYCWGGNTSSELGNGDTVAYDGARLVGTPSGAALTNVTAVSAGYLHSCAVANKVAYCWGFNDVGQLGDDSTATRTGAVAVVYGSSSLANVTAISAGNKLSCAIANKQAYCWGGAGSVGDGTGSASLTAQLVVSTETGLPLTSVTAIAAGYDHACAVSNKTVYCWGSNSKGQVGDHSFVDATAAVKVKTSTGAFLDKATAVGAGDMNSCAISNKVTYCWGDNGDGQLGDGSTDFRSKANPVMVDATTALGAATQLGVGGYHACAVVSKKVYCWGNNGDGQLATGSVGGQSLYAVVAKFASVGTPDLTNVTQVQSGYYHTCALIAKQVYCWGDNSNGKLGDGTAVDRSGAVPSLFHVVQFTGAKGL